MLNIPSELEDAARIDGCSWFRVLCLIVLPISMPAVAALSTLAFTAGWNDYLSPLVVINKPDIMTIIVGLASLRSEATPWGLLMAEKASAPPARAAGSGVFWFNQPPQQEAFQKIVERFHQAHDGVEMEVVLVPGPDVPAKLATAIAGGETPDAVRLGDPAVNSLFITNGHAAALDDWDPKIGTYDWLPGVQKAVTRNGKMNAMPVNSGVQALVYNKDVYQKAGLDPDKPPATLDQLLEVAGKISAGGGGGGAVPGGAARAGWPAEHPGQPGADAWAAYAPEPPSSIDSPTPHRHQPASGRVPDPLEPVEDQIDPELELVRVVVAEPQDVLDGHLGEVGVRVGGELTEDALRHIDDLLRRRERQARLLQGESVDVAVQDGVRVRGHRDREACRP